MFCLAGISLHFDLTEFSAVFFISQSSHHDLHIVSFVAIFVQAVTYIFRLPTVLVVRHLGHPPSLENSCDGTRKPS